MVCVVFLLDSLIVGLFAYRCLWISCLLSVGACLLTITVVDLFNVGNFVVFLFLGC